MTSTVRTISTFDATPQNIEAEQQILGAILCDNLSMHKIAGFLRDDHFYDPVHGILYEKCRRMIADDRVASPVTLKAFVDEDPSFEQLGGSRYLVRLAGVAISPGSVADYAGIVKDLAERRLALDLIGRAQQSLIGGDDRTGDVLSRLETALGGMQDQTDGRRPVSMMAATTAALRDVHSAFLGEALPVVTTGIPALDKVYAGFGEGEFVILGGRPGMGKTAVALGIALNAARAGHHVVFASLEMHEKSLALRALSEGSARTGDAIEYSKARRGQIDGQDMVKLAEVAKEISQLPITFLPREYSEIGTLPAGVRQALRAHPDIEKTPLIILDYLQLMRADGKRSVYETVTEISKAGKQLAMKLNAPILALSQLSRAVEGRDDKRPMLSDLRDSGQIEQDADAVLFCYRPAYYLAQDEPKPGSDSYHDDHLAWTDAMERVKHRLEIIVAKQRQGPAPATALVGFAPATNLIFDGGQS